MQVNVPNEGKRGEKSTREFKRVCGPGYKIL